MRLTFPVLCVLLLLVNDNNIFGQGWYVPPSCKVLVVDEPADETIYSVDFASFKLGKSFADDKGAKHGKIIKSADNLNAYRVGPESLLFPSLPEKSITGKYITLECDFRFVDSLNSMFIVEFPNHSGYKRYFEISRQWLTRQWDGKGPATCGLDGRFQMIIKKGYCLTRFDSTAWHCLTASFSEDRLMIFIDNYFIIGIGKCWNATNEYDFPGEGYLPGQFAISGKAGIDIRYVRYAQSKFVPRKKVEKTSPFAKILTETKLVTHRILFDVGSATIKNESLPYIDSVSDWLLQNPGVRLEVGGHTDSDGGTAANLALSQRRAASIVMRLVHSGVDSDRVVAKGYGAAAPLQGNDTESGKAANRRVEFRKL
jgi:outer membrane protein OmpA-like peptidoglycan-associated protein